MRHFTSLDQIPADFGPSAVSIGKFDGMHVGHRSIVDQLRAVAGERGLVSTVLTFDRNPLSVIAPDRSPENVVSSTQRRDLIAAAGVEAMLEITFDRGFSRVTAEDFVRSILVEALHAKMVLVGPGTRFGARGTGDLELLRSLGETSGFEVRELGLVRDASGEPVSSSRIRADLARGDVLAASALLGRLPSVRGMVVRGLQRGRELGYPTANLSPALEGLIPADGVYAGFLTDSGRRMPAAISIGNNPTFDGVADRQVEAHVIDEDLDLYDRVVEVEFAERVRGMEKFDSLDALIAQMDDDTAKARKITALG